jgi:glycosyltransferase involved in cell wall biosynthesis
MLVSILIPCYNAERWIRQCIESALTQDWPDCEVIVVDDGSTDGSLAIIKSFDGRIRWESGPNRGSNPCRNRLLELAGGAWLQYLDADDYLLPGKVSAQARFLQDHSGVDVVFGPVTLEHRSATAAALEALPIPEPHDPWILLPRWFLPQTGSPLWRKQAVVDVGGWRIDQRACQEHDLYLRLLAADKVFAYFDSNGAVYRQWSEGTLWKRDQPLTRRLRLEILERCEATLGQRGELTPPRLWAINQGRFETARSEWQHEPGAAVLIAERIRRSQPDFLPGGPAAPPSYQRLYRWFGFKRAEQIADWRRAVMR